MPQGKEHLILWRRYKPVSYVFSFIFTIIGFLIFASTGLFWFILLGIFYQTGYLLGYYIDPDFDQESTTSGKWRLMRNFKLLGAFIAGWFIPYGYLFKHRSFLSHTPIVSTFIRLLWLSLFPLTILFFYALLYMGLADLSIVVFSGIWFGLSLADAVHAFADWGIIKVYK